MLNRYVSLSGDDGENETSLNMLFALADHEITSVSDVTFNDVDSSNFSGVSIKNRNGGLNQLPLPGFESLVTQTAQSIELTPDVGNNQATFQTSGNGVTGIGVGFYLQACFTVSPKGELIAATHSWLLEYKKTTDGSYSTWGTKSVTRASRNPFHLYWELLHLEPAQYDIRVTHTAAPPDETNASTRSSFVEYTAEITEDRFTYPGASVLGVQALATSDLNTSQPTVKCVVSRGFIRLPWGNVGDRNPAWQCYDIMINTEYGRMMSAEGIIDAEFHDWAAFCEENSLYCDVYHDTKTTEEDALVISETIGRGRLVRRNGKVGVVIDRITAATKIFNMGDVVEDSLEVEYIPDEDLANIIQVTYWDGDNGYVKKTEQISVPGYDPNNDPTNISAITLIGCTDRTLAHKHATYLLNGNLLQGMRIKFAAAVDSIGVELGDVFGFSFDAMEWGESGRIVSSTSSSATLDRQVTLLAGVSYKIVVQHQDTDVIEEQDLAAVGEDVTSATVNLSGTWDNNPAQDAVVSVGTAADIYKEFRVTNIDRSFDDMHREVHGLLYDEGVYDDDVTLPDEPSEKTHNWVYDLQATQLSSDPAGNRRIGVALTWMGEAIQWSVFYRVHGDTRWIPVAEVSFPKAVIWDLEIGETYDFKVGVPSRSEAVTTSVLITAVAADDPIDMIGLPDVTGLEIIGESGAGVWDTVDLRLAWDDMTTLWTADPSDARAFPRGIDRWYEVRIYESDNSTLRFSAKSWEPFFTYTLDQNKADGSGSPEGDLYARVWMADSAGKTSSSYASLHCQNQTPATPSVSTQSFMNRVRFTWSPNTEVDFAFFKYRFSLNGSDWEGWLYTDGTAVGRELTNAEGGADPNQRIYIQVHAVDIFGIESSAGTADALADAVYVSPSSIDDFEDISAAWPTIPMPIGDVWTDSGNYASWNEHSVWYDGTEYTITAGDTSAYSGYDDVYVVWRLDVPTVYSVYSVNPNITVPYYVVAMVRSNGVAVKVWVAMANAIIGSAYIRDAAITNAKIDTVSAAKIIAGSIMTPGVYIGDAYYTGGTALDDLKPAEAGADVTADNIPVDLHKIFYQSGAPGSGMTTGDIWVNSDDNQMYRWSGFSWTSIQDDNIAVAVTQATTAANLADDKVRIFWKATAPTDADCGEGTLDVGDLWFETDAGNKPYRYNGSSWVAELQDWSNLADLYGSMPDDNATVGANWNTNLSNKPADSNLLNDQQAWADIVDVPGRFGDAVSGAGLYLTSTYLGWYNGSSWSTSTFIHAGDGYFQFYKDSTNYFRWNASEFTFATDDGVTIKSGGSLTIENGGNVYLEDGGDMHFDGNDTNPATLFFDGTSKYSAMFATGDGTVLYLSPQTTDVQDYQIGRSTFKWDNVYIYAQTNLVITTDVGYTVTNSIRPSAGGTYDLGESTYYWNTLWADSVHYGTLTDSYDKYDDLDLLSKTKAKIDPVDGKEKLDLRSLPDDFFADKDGQINRNFINQKRLISLLIGAIKQVDGKLKDFESRIAALEKK